jgi:nitroreductase
MPTPPFSAEFLTELRRLLAWRRDVRRFRPEPLPDGTLERLLEIACLAPSVGLQRLSIESTPLSSHSTGYYRVRNRYCGSSEGEML